MKKWIYRIVFVVSLCVFGYSAYNLWDIYSQKQQVATQTKQLEKKVIKKKRENKVEKNVLEPDWAALQAENQDIVGWIYVPDCDISFPVMQSKDNEYFLIHCVCGVFFFCGSFFLVAFGFGVFQVKDEEECKRVVLDAIDAGYRLIDTAQSYGNEEAVCKAIQETSVPREELFITTKVWISNYGYEKAKASVEESLKKMQLDYFDLVLLHQPFKDYHGAYRALIDLYKENKANGGTSSEFLEKAANIPCMYVPMFYDVSYNEDGTIKEMKCNNPNIQDVVK